MCRYERAPDGSKHWLPDCMGGAVYGEQGCTCERAPKKSKLEKKIEELEKRIALLEGAKNTEQANQPDSRVRARVIPIPK